MALLMRIISALLTIYILIIFIRLILSWFNLPVASRGIDIIHRITDPYLTYFRRFKFLTIGKMDFSPIAAIMVLVVVQNVARFLGSTGRITLGIFFSIVLGAAWSGFAFILHFFIAITVIRFLSIIIARGSAHPIWQTLDYMIAPVAERINRIFSPGKLMVYSNLLIVTALIFAGSAIGGRLIISLLMAVLQRLPI